jgi:hypothetical protein
LLSLTTRFFMIEVSRLHFIHDCINDGKLEMDYIKTGDQLVDLLTKPLAHEPRSSTGATCPERDLQHCVGTTWLGGVLLLVTCCFVSSFWFS